MADPMFDDNIYILQKVDMSQHVAADRDDIGILPFTHSPNLI
jgi:hypothetical protein